MNVDFLGKFISAFNNIAWGWPLIIFVLLVGAIAMVTLNFVQFRYFIAAWRALFSPSKEAATTDMSPFQAFINALSASIGNGSLAGMATAIYSGGPGAAFWVFVLGIFSLAIRFSEVYLSTVTAEAAKGSSLGGPMVYLRQVPGGSFLPVIYAVFCLILSMVGGNAMQCNSIRVGLEKMTNMDSRIIAAILFAGVVYIMAGGARRIVRASEAIIPFKVGLFFISAFIVLVYHWQSLIPALSLMVTGAFNPKALMGALIGYTVQDAIRFGMSRSLNATEAGLGTAGVLFGSTGSKDPVGNGILSMVATFISYYLVCFVIMWIIIASGVWNSGLTSTALTIAAFQTAFGAWGGWVVTLLSVIFGLGVLVAYAYIGRECWRFLTGSRWLTLYTTLYCFMALYGALAQVGVVWDAIDMANAGMMAINLFAILWLLPEIRRGLQAYQRAKQT